MLPTASKSHSFTILHNYLVSNQSYRGKKEKNPSDQTIVWPQDFSSIKMEDVWFLKQQIASKFYFYHMKATYYNPALVRPDL